MPRFSVVVLLLVVVAAIFTAAPPLAEAMGLVVELDVVPSEEAAGLYEVTARIRDAESGEMLLVPTIVFPKGEEPARVTSSSPTGGVLEFTISISDDTSTLDYAVERREEDAVVASQKATIRLDRRGE